MCKVVLAAILLSFVAFNTLAQDEIHVGAGQIRCDTVAEILMQHGYLPLVRQYSSIDVRVIATWRNVRDTIGPLAKAYGCPPVVSESRIGPTGIEISEPDVINPDAHISFPRPVYVVRHRVAIRGTVTVPNLGSFFVEARSLRLDMESEQEDDVDPTWYPVTLPRIAPVRDDVLGIWDTQSWSDGLYELRLVINTYYDPEQFVYVGPIRVEKIPSFAVASLEASASDQPAPTLSTIDSADPLVFSSKEYGLSPVIGPVSIPKGFHLVSWKNTSGTGDGRLLVQAYALSPCFAFHETGADEDLLFGYDSSRGESTAVLKVVEDDCQMLLEVNSTWGLTAWELQIQSM